MIRQEKMQYKLSILYFFKFAMFAMVKINLYIRIHKMKLYHLSEITLWVKSHNKSIELGSLAWGEKRKWKFFQFFSENVEHLKKKIILLWSCFFYTHLLIFWLKIEAFNIFSHLEQSLWIFLCFCPFFVYMWYPAIDSIWPSNNST